MGQKVGPKKIKHNIQDGHKEYIQLSSSEDVAYISANCLRRNHCCDSRMCTSSMPSSHISVGGGGRPCSKNARHNGTCAIVPLVYSCHGIDQSRFVRAQNVGFVRFYFSGSPLLNMHDLLQIGMWPPRRCGCRGYLWFRICRRCRVDHTDFGLEMDAHVSRVVARVTTVGS